MSSASLRTLLKFCQRWELNILWSGASARCSQCTFAICFGVPCLSSVLPCHLIQLTTCGDQLTVQLLLHLSVQNIMARDLVPRTLIDIFMFKYCVHYWQSPIRENHWGSNQEVHSSQMEYSQEPHPATPRRLNTLNHHSAHKHKRQSGLIPWPEDTGKQPSRPTGENTKSSGIKATGYKDTHPSLPPLTKGKSRLEQSPSSLLKTSRALTMHWGKPDYIKLVSTSGTS